MLLRKALQSVNITGSIRIDDVTGKASVIDVIKMMCPELNDGYANIVLGRVITRDEAESGDPIMGDGTRVALADRVERVQINGKGRTTPSRKRRPKPSSKLYGCSPRSPPGLSGISPPRQSRVSSVAMSR